MLIIPQVGEDTAGVYSCMPDNISPATINIDIIRSKEEQLAVTNTGPRLENPELILLGIIVTLGRVR